jgi:hypothetical protein
VTIRCRARHRFRSEIAAGARPILDHEGLLQGRREPVGQRAGDEIDRAAGHAGDDEFDRAGRIGVTRVALRVTQAESQRRATDQPCAPVEHVRLSFAGSSAGIVRETAMLAKC